MDSILIGLGAIMALILFYSFYRVIAYGDDPLGWIHARWGIFEDPFDDEGGP